MISTRVVLVSLCIAGLGLSFLLGVFGDVATGPRPVDTLFSTIYERGEEASADATNVSLENIALNHSPAGRPPASVSGNNERKTTKTSGGKPQRIGGRDGPDDSHFGMRADPTDHMFHAYASGNTSNACRGTGPREDCVSPEAVEWVRKHLLLSIISGKEGAFRVEVSQCSWLSHFPPENVFVFSDIVPADDRTPHTWVGAVLPPGVEERNGDFFSEHVKGGYVQQVRSAGQGYSAAWIAAQFRFVQALEHMINISRAADSGKLEMLRDKNAALRAKGANAKHFKWFMIADDDTIVNINHLVARLQQSSFEGQPHIPWYLSRKGWGGAGHLYNHKALYQMDKILPECTMRYMIKSFRASDAMLLKCSGMAKLASQKEQTMSHCPASNLGVNGVLSPTQVTFHGKKDFYPPVPLTMWRVYLYYLAGYCKDKRAAHLIANEFSACAYGNCKQVGCTKERDKRTKATWAALQSRALEDANNSSDAVRVPLFLLKQKHV